MARNPKSLARRRVFVASKTMLRKAKGPMPAGPRVEGSQGPSVRAAADAPISHYSIRRDGREIGTVPHQPQVTKAPFTLDVPQEDGTRSYSIATVDVRGRSAKSDALQVS